MRLAELPATTWHRIRRPVTWGAVLGFGLLWNLMRWGFGFSPDHWLDVAYPFALPFAYLVLAPVPWQWTGDARPLASPARGLLQAIPWNLVWILTLSVIIGLGHVERYGGRRGGGGRPGQGQGQGQRQGFGRGSGPRPEGPRMEHAEPTLLDRLLHPRAVTVSMVNLSFALLLGWILADKERAERRESDAVRAAAAAKARALQAQMNPHVLFNAIGGLTELVREDAKAAEDALVSLAGLLRSLLENSARPRAPLAVERALLEQYLDLERIRLGTRLRVVWDWDRGLEGLELPPLLLQPLVENAIKHGIANSRGGGDLRIFLQSEDGFLRLGVANTGEPLIDGSAEGIGMKNLRERLTLLGEGPDALRLFREGSWTVAELRLKTKGMP